MTTSSTEPDATSSAGRRSALASTVIGAAVVVAAVVVGLVLVTGHAGGGDRSPGTRSATGYDLSTPEAAARSFAAAAETGSGDTLLGLACLGRPACVRAHAAGLPRARLAEEQAAIRDGVYELADHLTGAEFTTAVDGDAPGTKDVPYRTPALTGDAYLTLTFVESEGDWLYHGPAD